MRTSADANYKAKVYYTTSSETAAETKNNHAPQIGDVVDEGHRHDGVMGMNFGLEERRSLQTRSCLRFVESGSGMAANCNIVTW